MGGDDKEILISSTTSIEDDSCSEINPYCETTTIPKITLLHNNNENYNIYNHMISSSHGQQQQQNNNNILLHSRYKIQRIIITLRRFNKNLIHVWKIHWKIFISIILTICSSSGCLIFFPKHIENITKSNESDGYSACLATITISTILTILLGISYKITFSNKNNNTNNTIFYPIVSITSIIKIGFSTGLSLLTIFYSWEDHKVLCNFQDPLLALTFLFSFITHAVSKWRDLGFRRSFALIAITAGIFVSVDYSLVDHHRCRGHFYIHPPKDPWTWQVHLVWTLAFVVSIWLWTVAMFCMESALPQVNEMRISHIGDEYNAVRMKVIRVRHNGTDVESHLENPLSLSSSSSSSSSSASSYQPRIVEPDLLQTCSIQNFKNIYPQVSYLRVYNAVLWFHLSAWFIIISLFWTEFIPGFGKGIGVDELPGVLWAGLENSLSELSSWYLILFGLIFSQSFAYLLLIIRSPLLTIGISCIGFPIVGLWWSLFQIKYNVFVWMPMFSGELICSILSFPLILGGIYYLFRLDVLKLDYKFRSRNISSL